MRDLISALEADMRPLLQTRHTYEPSPPGRRHWLAALAVATIFASVLGLLIADVIHQQHEADRARTSLTSTNHAAARVAADLSALRHELGLLTSQVGSDTTTLDQDASQLRGAETALHADQAHVSQQGSQIVALHTCLGGVQQSLNALAVGKQPQALALLGDVSQSCSAAAASGG